MLKKYNSIAIVLALTSVCAFAEEAQQPAPVPVVPVRGNNVSIPLGEISNYIRGFYVKTEGECGQQTLKMHGMVHPKCLKHLRLELDDPATDNTGSWVIRLEKANYVDPNNGGIVLEDAAKDCSAEITSQCVLRQEGVPASPNDCVDISEIRGFASFKKALTEDGDIQYRVNKELSPKTPFELHSLSDAQGDVEKIETCKTQEARAKKEKFDNDWNELVQMCTEALEQGDLDRYSEFRSKLDKILSKKESRDLSAILKRLDGDMSAKAIEAIKARINKIKTADDVDGVMVAIDDFLKQLKDVDPDSAAKYEIELKVSAINKGIDAQPGLAGYNDLIDVINRFGRDSEHKDARKKAVELLLIVAKNANEQGGFSDEEFQAKSMVVERAIATASRLDPKNRELKKGLYAAKLERFKASAASGNSKYYNSKTRKEMARTAQEMGKFAQSTRDQEAYKMYSSFAQSVTPNQVIPIDRMDFNPLTGQPVQQRYYTMGNKLDSDFYKAQNETQRLSLDDQFNLYKQNFMSGVDGLGGTYQTGARGGSSDW